MWAPLELEVLLDRLGVRADHLAVEAVEEDAVARLVRDLGGEEDPLIVGRRGDRERQQLRGHALLADEELGEEEEHPAPLLVREVVGVLPLPGVLGEVERPRSSSPGAPSGRSACRRRAPLRRCGRARPSPCRCRRRGGRRGPRRPCRWLLRRCCRWSSPCVCFSRSSLRSREILTDRSININRCALAPLRRHEFPDIPGSRLTKRFPTCPPWNRKRAHLQGDLSH